MPSGFPTSTDSFSTSHQDGVAEIVHASTINDVADAVNRIEAEIRTGNWFNVKHFGAVGDASHDDTTAINAAISAAVAASPFGSRSIIYFPRGYYVVSSPILMNNDYMSFVGAGRLQSTLMLNTGGSDLSAVISIGSTRIVQQPGLFNISVEGGRDKGHTTGHGIICNANAPIIQHVYVANAPQDGVRFTSLNQPVSIVSVAAGANPSIGTSSAHNLSAGQNITIAGVNGATEINGEWTVLAVVDATHFTITLASHSTYTSSGTVSGGIAAFSIVVDDLYMNVPGRDGVYLDANQHDSDLTKVLIRGGTSIAARGGRYGVYNRGAETHLYDCHPFFMATDGLRSDLGSVQVIGGEYESNGNTGINLLTQTGDCLVQGVTGFYGNVSNDISTANISAPNRVTIIGNSFRSVVSSRNVIIGSDQVMIHGNSFRFGATECLLLNGANHCTVTGNIFDTVSGATRSVLILNGTHNVVAHNVVAPTNPRNINESGTANFNLIQGNILNGASVTLVGANSVSVNNL